MDGWRGLREGPERSGTEEWALRSIDARFVPRDPIFDADEDAERHPLPIRRRGTAARTVAAAVLCAAPLACGGPEAGAIAPDAVLVQLQPGAMPAATPADDSAPAVAPLALVSGEPEAPLLRVPIAPGSDPQGEAARASAQQGVEFAEPIYLYRGQRTPDDPRFRDLWGMAKIQAEKAWATTTGDRRVVVAVVDDGVALDHPDLKDNLWTNPDEIPGNGKDDDGDGIVDDVHGANFVDGNGDPSPATSGDERWHGTHVAGTIGAVGNNGVGVVGVNWKVSLMAVRGIGPNGGRTDDLARSIDYAAEHGARVINGSWGGGGASRVIQRAIESAGRKGALFVAAAGNDGSAAPGFPANLKLDTLLSVGATTPDDALAPFSNRGALVAAPGVGILSTTAPGRYERYDGTSMAAPHVSGLAALIWAAHPDATVEQVRSAILSSGVAVDGVRNGRIDAARALAAFRRGGAGGGVGDLVLSRSKLTFALRPGRRPHAQVVSLHAAGGAHVAWTAKPAEPWITLSRDSGETPARVSIRVDPAGLGRARTGHVTFTDESGGTATLEVTVQGTNTALVAAFGAGCELKAGALHVQAGSACGLRASTGVAPGVSWLLPDGRRVDGGTLYARFARRGSFELGVRSDSAAAEPVAIVVE